ncbi:MAG: hypothetical protein ABFS45_22665 [Pseudomonadota bacterium]
MDIQRDNSLRDAEEEVLLLRRAYRDRWLRQEAVERNGFPLKILERVCRACRI